jgi:hypothetical protein
VRDSHQLQSAESLQLEIAIQRPYVNEFESIGEYDDAIRSGEIDFLRVIGLDCPICGQKECYRPIPGYSRTAIDLFPYREGRVLIARFRCRTTMRTFSLLPHQLAPYHRYTVSSMVQALELAHQVQCEDGGGMGATVQELSADCRVTPWLLSIWLTIFVVCMRRAHHVLGTWYELSQIRSGETTPELLVEVHQYFMAVSLRGPPGRPQSIQSLLKRYTKHSGRYLVGTPSQKRG